jgi:hypothetical protein
MSPDTVIALERAQSRRGAVGADARTRADAKWEVDRVRFPDWQCRALMAGLAAGIR